MKLMFSGAAHEVTGSCYYLEAAGKKFLVDCGMEQGPNLYVNHPIPVPASELDFVLLTHAHIDHSGNLPELYAKGFRGPVYTTEATADLCNVMLRDSAHIQMFEAEWRNRKNRRAGKEEFIPAYTIEDALGLIQHLNGQPYNRKISICEGIKIRFVDAGHLLGSASIEVWIQEEDVERKIVFSGDIGNVNQPLINDPVYLSSADYVVMESTYGDRSHTVKRSAEAPVRKNAEQVESAKETIDYAKALAEVIQKTLDKGGNVVIPSFAVGRTQEMLYFIRQIKKEGMVHGHDGFPVYVDSPLAIEATSIFDKHYGDCFDEEARALIAQGINPIRFPGLKTSITSEDSKAINFNEEPKVIISASGMCDAGRIKHHLKHNLWRPECTVLFVGYQAVGTPGRALVDGAERIRLFGEEVQVQAEIKVLPGVSGHADNQGLMRWAAAFKEKPTKVFVTHGEDQVTELFAERLKKELGYEAIAPFSGMVVNLMSGEIEKAPEPVKAEKRQEKAGTKRGNTVFERLWAAGQRLLTVIRHNEGGANKDLAKFTDQIHSLCDKWDR